jgi:MSHA biogenesis protein MshK
MRRAQWIRVGFVLILAGARHAAFSQGMVDPTRPPAALSGPEITEDAVRGPVLQSIMIGPHSRWAVISGQRVELGGRYGDARVAAISENEVILRSNSGTDVLRLYPDVYMKTPKGAGRTVRKPPLERN